MKKHTTPFRKIAYSINILAIIYVMFMMLFFANFITKHYKNSAVISDSIDKEYNNFITQYEKLATFILQNNLPQKIQYFNAACHAMYDLPPIKELNAGNTENILRKSKTHNNAKLINIKGCYGSRCIKITADTQAILSKISTNKFWGQYTISTIPIKKTTLLNIGTKNFFATYKYSLLFSLAGLLALYLFQAIFLLIKNDRLNRIYCELLTVSNMHTQDLIAKSKTIEKLHNSSSSIYNLINDYFTHYAHHLIARDPYLEEINITQLLQKIENFFSHQMIKQKLKIILDNSQNLACIKSDNEALFIILLNLVFKAISRAKTSTEITIKISQTQDTIGIEITDIGYEYQPKANKTIKIYMLPETVLEELCRKANIVEIRELRHDELNTILVQIINPERETIEEPDKINSAIKIKVNPL